MMRTLRRLQFALSCLLAVLLVSGAALPSPVLWQCHHSARFVSTAAALPAAMPCAAAGARMPRMACCPVRPAPVGRGLTVKRSVSPPACHPSLTRLASLPAARLTRATTPLRVSLALLFFGYQPTSTALPSLPDCLSLRQRPPPTVPLSLFALKHVPGLRAPPAA